MSISKNLQIDDEARTKQFVTKKQRRLGRGVLAFSLVGWAIPVASLCIFQDVGAMSVPAVIILAGFYLMQDEWGASASGKIGMWIIGVWASILLVLSIALMLIAR